MCDESEGLGVGKILSDPDYLKFFGYGPAAEQNKKEEGEAEAAVEKPTETLTPAPNGIAADAPIADPAGISAAKPLEVIPIAEKAGVVVPVTQTVPAQ